MSSPFSHRSAQQLRAHGVDPFWYVVHRSIDNAKTGHSATILDAIVDYVDSTVGGEASEADLAQRVLAGFMLSPGSEAHRKVRTGGKSQPPQLLCREGCK